MTFGIPPSRGGRGGGRGRWGGKYRGGKGNGYKKRGPSTWSNHLSRHSHSGPSESTEHDDASIAADPESTAVPTDLSIEEAQAQGEAAWEASDTLEAQIEEVKARDELDEKMGFWRYREGPEKLGWMVNMHPTLVMDGEWPSGKSAADLYFLEEDGETFKATIVYEPYFFVICKPGAEPDLEEYVRKRFNKVVLSVERVEKDDLEMPNHLLGHKRTLLKLRFWNMQNLLTVRKALLPAVARNLKKQETSGGYEDVAELHSNQNSMKPGQSSTRDALDFVVDVREYDVLYYIRAAIDCDLRVGLWYNVKAFQGSITIEPRPDKVKRADPVVLAFDIETTKLPLKFPDAAIDAIMMISYMIDGQGFLITNREIVSEDIDDFEYTPKPEYEGPFTIFNEPDEEALIRRFFEHIQSSRPTVIVTYNGDLFDWPFVDKRATLHGIDMKQEIGFCKDANDEYKSFYAIHMDAFCWVKRDSYLPQGSQGLKAVTTTKLGYNPMELDPEDMTRFASEEPQTLAQYSVSDAVATYYLYMKYVHPFIFSLCNIIPMNPDDVLRRGSGTLCETLLMVQAFQVNVIMPNKHTDKFNQFFDGHLLESETYVGGHVEALEAGVFRSDLPTKFRLVPEAFQQLIDEIDAALRFSIVVEGDLALNDVVNYDEVKAQIIESLESLRDIPNRLEKPSIYHLDVAAMYPNIILTNRLQPDAIVEEETCAACDFNQGPGSSCQRKMTWSWRGEYFPAKRSEYNMIRNQMEQEKFPGRFPTDAPRAFHDLRPHEQSAAIKKRLSTYSRKVYNKIHETKVVAKESIVCQRENPFYVDTVRAFRDRRYEYKGLLKTWKKKLDDASGEGDLTKVDEAKKLIVVYDSLQLAHKCILNSFYGYVMRKGARWYSMEMAGIVCLTGAKIIQLARARVEQIGRPLELDTDGIWCIFPATFPENFAFKLKNGKVFPISYPCVMLNHLVHDQFTNHQYQQLEDKGKKTYSTRSENTIFFEVDGPYRAMILPSSTEEDKLLKKRYAVFNDDGTLAELKGFEVKRRGELKLIKIFQSQIFKVFLEGLTLEECYSAVARVANQWLDVLYSKGAHLDDNELFDLISENRNMSKSLEQYGAQKSTSISTAKRLAEFLGDQMVKDKGLNCKFVISCKPFGLPVSERAIPVVIFQAEAGVRKHFLRKWLKDNSMQTFDIRDILDWQYYLERFGSVIQKLITIPAAMQGVTNPVTRVRHPDWLFKRVAAKDDKTKQFRITEMFKKRVPGEENQTAESLKILPLNGGSDAENHDTGNGPVMADLEDIGSGKTSAMRAVGVMPVVTKTSKVLGKRKTRVQQNPPQRIQEDYSMLPMRDQPENQPDPNANYGAWLDFQKRKWKRRRAQREMQKALFGAAEVVPNDPSIAHSGALGVQNFFRRQTQNILASSWQILQIAETDTPGDFRVWALVEGTLHAMKLSVPRTLYVNSRIPDPDENSDRVGVRMIRRVRTLPRSHPCLYLYEMTMSEPFYRENSGMFASMSNHQEIEGVYETQIPLLFRALIKLGCVAAVDRKRMLNGRGLEDGFDLDEVIHKPIDVHNPYLGPGTHLNYLYLFHAGSGSRQILGLFSTAAKRAWQFIIDPAKNKDAVPNLRRLFCEQLAEMGFGTTPAATQSGPSRGGVSTDADPFEYGDDIEVTTTISATEIGAMVAVNRTLREYQSQKRGATILALQSPKTSRHLLMDGISLIHDFPVISIPAHRKDLAFPALSWQQYACKRMVSHYLHLSGFLKERIALSRYADVPFCNFADDYTSFVADLGLARRLKRADMILWYSASNKPDLGGREQDDNRFELDEVVNPEMNVPGSYETVCIEIQVWDLALNTLMHSGAINDMDGATGALGGGNFAAVGHLMDDYTKELNEDGEEVTKNAAISVDESQVTPATFSVLKSMVMGWADEVRRRNRFASYLLEHLYRWLTSSSSRLFDPALFSLVHGLMRRIFVQLIAEFKRLGSKIVFATFDKIVLATSKTDMQTAIGYGKYVLEAIQKKPMFETMELKADKYWGFLMWMDAHNFGGVQCDNAAALITMHTTIQEGDERPKPNLIADMEWNIGEYLPPAVQQRFMKTIAEYIFEIQTFKQKALTHMPSDGEAPSITETGDNSPLTAFLRDLVNTRVKQRLLRIVPDIVRKRDGNGDPNAYIFPSLPGSHLTMTNPALEFSKCISAVFGLHPGIEREVRVLKRDMLSLIGAREFSNEAKFMNPCEPFRLPQVICEFCNHCRDLDLTRDKDLLPRHLDDGGEADSDGDVIKGIAWSCPACQTEYDKQAIEQRLVDVVQRRLAAWQQQDVKCSRCRMVKAEDMREHCASCSGLVNTEWSREEFVRRTKVFSNIARFHDMRLLREIVGWVLEIV
ncbi:DNA-directed DNA polymerase [Powellomyces hirtus]|uniref:DNA polymerase epsilon catalytic subunit n=1 Tax=Powellomyces hirtus TaxID=109895 RepID=A0A507E3C9_9FUNG|nr:DNA-directed DNA polymerase [Powellomyces hirtus]